MIFCITAFAVLIAGAGIFTRSWVMLVVAGVLAAPLALYLGMTPRFRWSGFLLAVLPLVAALFVRDRRWVAGSLVAIFALSFFTVEAIALGAF